MANPFLEQLLYFQTPENRADYVSLPGGSVDLPEEKKVNTPQKNISARIKRVPTPPLAEQRASSSGDDEYSQYMDEILKEKKGSIEGVQKQLEAAQNSGHWSDKLNLSPLAAWLDTTQGTNMAGAFQGPTPEEKRQALVAKLGEALQKQKDDYANEALSFFKNKAYMDQVKAQQENAAEDRKFDRWYKKEKLEIDRDKNKNTNGKELSQNMIRTINEGNQIPAMLEDVRTAIKANQDIMGPIEGRRRALNPWDTESSTLDAQVRAVSQAFGRYMEGGVLRKEDEAKYRKMFPNSSDTPEVAANKLLIVERLLKQRQGSDIEAFKSQGYNLNGLDKGFSIPDLPGALGGMKRPLSLDELNQLSDEELEAYINVK